MPILLYTFYFITLEVDVQTHLDKGNPAETEGTIKGLGVQSADASVFQSVWSESQARRSEGVVTERSASWQMRQLCV
jgi:hypothetical protein